MANYRFMLLVFLLGFHFAYSQPENTVLPTLGIPRDLIGMLEEKSGAKAKEISLSPGYPASSAVEGVSVEVDFRQSWKLVEELSSVFKSSGCVIFVISDNYGINGMLNSVAVFQTADPFDILRIMDTKGVNPDRSNEEIIAKLKEWDKEYGIEILGAGKEWVKMKVRNMPVNARPFAKEIYKFCPGIIDSGIKTIDNLGIEISKNRMVSLWWD